MRLAIQLSDGGVVTHTHVHTVILLTFVGPRPAGMDCCHNDGNAENNRIGNLRWDTRKANRTDSIRHGTQPYGISAGRAILNFEKAQEIRKKYVPGVISKAALGAMYGVGETQVYRILQNKVWTQPDDLLNPNTIRLRAAAPP